MSNPTQNTEETVTISKAEYAQLKKRDLTLTALEQGGVDNWEWYGESIENFEKEFGEIK